MSFIDFLKALLRQATYALTLFTVVTLAAESFTPGSVTPFLDPIPLTITALLLLGADAVRRDVKPHIWMRIVASIFFGIAITALSVSKIWPGGRLDAVVICFVIASVSYVSYCIIRTGKAAIT